MSERFFTTWLVEPKQLARTDKVGDMARTQKRIMDSGEPLRFEFDSELDAERYWEDQRQILISAMDDYRRDCRESGDDPDCTIEAVRQTFRVDDESQST